MEKQQPLDSLIKKEGLSHGFALGFLFLVINILMMYWIASTTSFIVASLGSMLIYVFLFAIAIFFCLRFRKRIGGYWTFRESLTGIFVMFLVSGAVGAFGGLVFEKFVEPDLQERMFMNIQNNTIVFMENQGVSDEEIDKATAALDEAMENAATMDWGQRIKSYAIMIIILFVVSMVFAGIFKRERPIFAPVGDGID